MNRRERHGAIMRLVRAQPISTQTELAEALRAAGHDVVQTTVSRDVHELGLVKVRDVSGRLVYAPSGTPDRDRLDDLRAAFARWALSCESSGPLVLVTTPSGAANALAQVIDESGHPLVLGTVAGNNTILVVPRDSVTGARLRDALTDHLMEGAA